MAEHEIPGRAVTDTEKTAVLNRLGAVWKANPELRLGQLIINVFKDPYYVEDVALVSELEAFYGREPGASPGAPGA